MQIKNHRIEQYWYRQSSNVTPATTIVPRFVVLHYTTGWDGAASRDWLLGAAGGSSNQGSSAHLVIDRDGGAWQICPFNRRAWHAGPSRLGSLRDLNSHAIGIELVNPGWLKPDGLGGWIDGHGHHRSDQQLIDFGGYLLAPHSRVGADVYAWPRFADAQIRSARAICELLVHKYAIQAFVTHEQIDTRGWKTDPGPAFPMAAFSELVEDFGRVHRPLRHAVNATRLNLRGGPGLGFERVDPPGQLGRGTLVDLQHQDQDWAYIEVADGEHAGVLGWVHASYLDRIWD